MTDPFEKTLREALERTLPWERFSAEQTREEIDRLQREAAKPGNEAGDSAGRDAPEAPDDTLNEFNDSSHIPEELHEEFQAAGPRFELIGRIGSGASSHVYAVHDYSLDRTIAVKYLRRSHAARKAVRGRFIHEARVTAKLEHPNILPVHDIGVHADHRIFFAMKNVQGITLRNAIRSAEAGEQGPRELSTVNRCVRLFLKVCDALSFAHDHGYIHQDVKPGNIMIGRYGEVLLLDWGSSLTASEADALAGKARFGTPAYMSPEQARRERVDERSDVYCVGATLFHTLTLRHPTWANDLETFWDKKRRGEIDPVTESERRKARPALIAIALKAMHPDPVQRYQRIDDMAEDLRRYQEGLSVSAHRETLLELAVRRYRRNRRLFWVSGAALALVLTTGGLLLQEKIKSLITWRLIYSENFSTTDTRSLDQAWDAYRSTNWIDMSRDTITDAAGPWWVQDGVLMGRGKSYLQDLTWSRPITGDLRVEWDAKTLGGVPSLNCYIGGATREDAYTFHLAYGGDPWRCELSKRDVSSVLDRVFRSTPIPTGRWLHFRMEKENQTVRLWVGRELLFEHTDPEMLSGPGHRQFGFENVLPNLIAIDNIKVYHHPPPLKVSPLTNPDQFLEAGLPALALPRYRAIVQAHRNHAVAAEAFYKIGRCLEELDSTSSALAAYERLDREYPNHPLAPFALHQRARVLAALGREDDERAVLATLARRFRGDRRLRAVFTMVGTRESGELRKRTAAAAREQAWDSVADWLLPRCRTFQRFLRIASLDPQQNGFLDEAVRYLGGTPAALPFDTLAAWFPAMPAALADVLRTRGAAEVLVTRYPQARREAARALLDAGAYELILRGYTDRRAACAQALLALGRYDELLRTYAEDRTACAQALFEMGRYEEVLASYPEQQTQCASALLCLGRCNDILKHYTLQKEQAAIAAAHTGRLAEYVSGMADQPPRRFQAVADLLHKPDSAADMLLASPGAFAADWHASQLFLCLRDAGRLNEVSGTSVRFHPALLSKGFVGLATFDSASTALLHNRQVRADRLLAVGEYDLVPVETPSFATACIEALARQDSVDVVRQRYPLHRRTHALLLLDSRRYDDVLTGYPDQRVECAEALLALGRYDTVLNSFPQAWEQTFRAALELKRNDHVDRYHILHRGVHAEHLYTCGEFDRVIELYPDQTLWYGLSLVKIGRPEALPLTDAEVILERLERVEISAVQAIGEAEGGRIDSCHALLSSMPPLYNLPDEYHLRFAAYLLKPIIDGLSGRTATMKRSLSSLVAKHELSFNRRLWYEAAYLLGSIDSSAFLAQPHRRFVRERLELLRAIRGDIRGDPETASDAYVRFAGIPRHHRRQTPLPLFASESVRELVQWRLRVLSPDAAASRRLRGLPG